MHVRLKCLRSAVLVHPVMKQRCKKDFLCAVAVWIYAKLAYWRGHALESPPSRTWALLKHWIICNDIRDALFQARLAFHYGRERQVDAYSRTTNGGIGCL